VEWGKVAYVLEHKSGNISETRIEEKLQWRAYRKSLTLFRTVPSPTPYGLLFPKIGGLHPPPKLQSLLSEERVNLRTSNLAVHSQGPSEQNHVKNFGEKGKIFREKGTWAYPVTAHILGVS